MKDEPSGESNRIFGSKPERVLLNPNPNATRTAFFNDLIRSTYFTGNGYAVATRDGNGSVDTLTIVDPKGINPVADPETNEVYYWVSPQPGGVYNPDTDEVYPSRNVLHLKINNSTTEPLKGVSPITAAANSIAASSAITGHQSRFFNNMARPSGLLSTEQALNREQMLQLRDAVAKQTQGNDSGKVPILGNGLKWESMSLSSQDAQLVQAYGMTVGSISRAFRIPPALINHMESSTFNNAETMMQWFLSSGLGFMLEHIELELKKIFSLPFSERINFNTKQLLRSNWESQMKALGEGVLKGIYSPNEARNMIGLPSVADGDEPRVQQQVVPLSATSASVRIRCKEPDHEGNAECQIIMS
jgi:HK97 family phage portal protein